MGIVTKRAFESGEEEQYAFEGEFDELEGSHPPSLNPETVAEGEAILRRELPQYAPRSRGRPFGTGGRINVTQTLIDLYDPTQGCPKCNHHPDAKTHSKECIARFRKIVAEREAASASVSGSFMERMRQHQEFANEVAPQPIEESARGPSAYLEGGYEDHDTEATPIKQ